MKRPKCYHYPAPVAECRGCGVRVGCVKEQHYVGVRIALHPQGHAPYHNGQRGAAYFNHFENVRGEKLRVRLIRKFKELDPPEQWGMNWWCHDDGTQVFRLVRVNVKTLYARSGIEQLDGFHQTSDFLNELHKYLEGYRNGCDGKEEGCEKNNQVGTTKED